MSTEPPIKRAVVFFGAENLCCMAKERFGYRWPNYDPHALADLVCKDNGWDLTQVRFYTGIPPDSTDPRRQFWLNKLANIGRKGAFVYHRDTRHGQEKGIDIRLALDVVGGAIRSEYDVAVIFSQDGDFSEVADEIRWIAATQKKWMKIACVFPYNGPQGRNNRGIPKTDWVRLSKAQYDSCIDPIDYRPR